MSGMFLNFGELCVNCTIVLPDMKCHMCVRIIYYGWKFAPHCIIVVYNLFFYEWLINGKKSLFKNNKIKFEF